MIKFFRKIRYDLMEKNKTGKYLKYAIGEIALVVIGILIALQINNWNNVRIEKNEEKKLLMNLKSEFEKNLNLLKDYDIVRIDRLINTQNILMGYSLNKKKTIEVENIDSILAQSFRHPTWNPSLMVLEDLKNSGRLSKISNENLKQQLYNWYSFYSDYLEDIKSSEEAFNDLESYNINNGYYYINYINTTDVGLKSNNVNLILNDKIFMSFLINYNRIVKQRKREYLDAQHIIEQIIEESNN